MSAAAPPRATGVDDEVLLARAYLSRVAEPSSVPLWGFVREVGPVEAVARIRSDELDVAGDLADGVRRAVAFRRDAVSAGSDLDAADRHGIRLIVPESDEWPHFAMSALEHAGLDRLARYRAGQRSQAENGELVPPLALWVRGAAGLATVGVRSVAIVGARAATAYGEQVAADLAYSLAARGFEVVSGGAYGIDAAAHRGALGAQGTTVLVSAGGLDAAYPPSSAGLFARAAETGLLVSESPPGTDPRRRRFLTRNRIIAALGTGTVVVEASQRSGARNTATHALGLDRPLMVVPGPITSAMSAGCHSLLRDRPQCALVTSADEIVELIGTVSDLPAGEPPAPDVDPVRQRLDHVDPDARSVHDCFPGRGVVRLDDLVVASGLSPAAVIASLSVLELAGLVERGDNGYRRAPVSRRGR